MGKMLGMSVLVSLVIRKQDVPVHGLFLPLESSKLSFKNSHVMFI